MTRTHLITGSASGIGKATAERLRAAGHRVIGADLRDAEIIADLALPEGRAKLAEEAARLAPEGLDGVVAGAGVAATGNPQLTIAINYFGAVATLEGLRALLAKSARARAVAICSTATLLPYNAEVVAACLGGDEAEALARAAQSPSTPYFDSKTALALWMRRAAARPEWGGAGVLLNGIGPCLVDTAMTQPIMANPQSAAASVAANPHVVEGIAQPQDIAEIIDFLLNFESRFLVGQLIFVDGGADMLTRPDSY